MDILMVKKKEREMGGKIIFQSFCIVLFARKTFAFPLRNFAFAHKSTEI